MDLLGDSTAKAPLHLNRHIDQLCDLFEQHLSAAKPALLGPFLDRIGDDGRSLLLTELVAMSYERMRGEGVGDPAAVLVALNPQLAAEITAAIGDFSNTRQRREQQRRIEARRQSIAQHGGDTPRLLPHSLKAAWRVGVRERPSSHRRPQRGR